MFVNLTSEVSPLAAGLIEMDSSIAAWDALPRLLRLSARHPLPLDRRQDNLGFRLAYDLA